MLCMHCLFRDFFCLLQPQQNTFADVSMCHATRYACVWKSSATVQIAARGPKADPVKFALQISTKASWSANQRQLRWDLSRMEAGTKGVLRASFTPEYANEALASAGVYGGGAATAACDVTCVAHFHGAPGQTLSGVAIESGSSTDATKPGKCMWHGTATAKPLRQ